MAYPRIVKVPKKEEILTLALHTGKNRNFVTTSNIHKIIHFNLAVLYLINSVTNDNGNYAKYTPIVVINSDLIRVQ